MDNDRVFAAYSLILIAGVASVITASVLAGVATLPTVGVFLEHILLSLLFRAAYKSIGGFDWILFLGPDTYTFEPREAPTANAAEALSCLPAGRHGQPWRPAPSPRGLGRLSRRSSRRPLR